jgi:hypothetical protein
VVLTRGGAGQGPEPPSLDQYDPGDSCKSGDFFGGRASSPENLAPPWFLLHEEGKLAELQRHPSRRLQIGVDIFTCPELSERSQQEQEHSFCRVNLILLKDTLIDVYRPAPCKIFGKTGSRTTGLLQISNLQQYVDTKIKPPYIQKWAFSHL